MTRSILISLLVTGGVAAAFAALRTDPVSVTEARQSKGRWLDAGVTAAQADALDAMSPGGPHTPKLIHPPPGSAYPAGFPAPRVMWSDDAASRTYRVEIKADGETIYTGFTRRRELIPSPEAWAIARTATQIEVNIAGGVVGPDGTPSGLMAVSSPSLFDISPTDDGPGGMILFGAKLRPPDRDIGTVHLLQMHLRIDALDLDQLQHRVVFRSSYGPEATRMHPQRLLEDREQGGGYGGGGGHGGFGGGPQGPGGPGDSAPPGNPSQQNGPQGGDPHDRDPHGDGGPDDGITTTQCVSCHAMSGDGKYIAVFSQAAEEAPPRFDAPNGFLTVLEMPERKILAQLPHAFMPMFNPKKPHLVAYGEVDETIGIKDQQMVRKSDLRVLDLQRGVHMPIPGADLPDRVENFPAWSPDGTKLTFIRAPKGEMWHGAAGYIDVATIDYNDGVGGTATDLPGASNNGKSNFLPIYTPNGKWIVFTQADQGFFSQQSADLYIVPAEGGDARKLGCNSIHTESWHRFSPNGKWLGVVTNREDIRRPHIYVARFDDVAGTCAPAVQLPVVAGPGAHTHAFSWTRRFPWLDDYELVKTLPN